MNQNKTVKINQKNKNTVEIMRERDGGKNSKQRAWPGEEENRREKLNNFKTKSKPNSGRVGLVEGG